MIMAGYLEYRDSGIPWIGNIPAHWNIQRGKNVLKLLERPVEKDDEVITCFRDGEVTLRKNRREDGFTVSLQEIGYQGIEPGDLVVHGMDGFAGSIGVSDSRGKATPVLNVMDSVHNKRYLMYYLRTAAYKDVFMSLSTGIRVRSCDLRWNKLSVFPFILPERTEQDAIVKYIDESLVRINTIITEAKASIEEYKAWKASIIYDAVTKGLNPDADMQDSGVKWIGYVPTHWKLVPFRYVLEERNERNDPVISQERLSLSIDLGVTLYADKTTNLDRFKEDFTQYKIAHPGDLVMNSMNMIVGASGVSSWLGCVSPAYYSFYDHEKDHVTAKFCEYIFRNKGMLRVLHSLGKGIYSIERGDDRINTCRLKVSKDDLKKILLPIPPMEEQREIVNYLTEKCTTIDALISEKGALITELEAYKKSMIFEVVTGKRRVISICGLQ